MNPSSFSHTHTHNGSYVLLEGGELTQQEEAAKGAVQGDAPVANTPLQVQCTAKTSELVVSLSFSSMSTTDRTRTLCTSKTKEHHKHDSEDEDSDKRKRKAMDQLRKVSTYVHLFFLLCNSYAY